MVACFREGSNGAAAWRRGGAPKLGEGGGFAARVCARANAAARFGEAREGGRECYIYEAEGGASACGPRGAQGGVAQPDSGRTRESGSVGG